MGDEMIAMGEQEERELLEAAQRSSSRRKWRKYVVSDWHDRIVRDYYGYEQEESETKEKEYEAELKEKEMQLKEMKMKLKQSEMRVKEMEQRWIDLDLMNLRTSYDIWMRDTMGMTPEQLKKHKDFKALIANKLGL